MPITALRYLSRKLIDPAPLNLREHLVKHGFEQ
jgi:hypothetical protein